MLDFDCFGCLGVLHCWELSGNFCKELSWWEVGVQKREVGGKLHLSVRILLHGVDINSRTRVRAIHPNNHIRRSSTIILHKNMVHKTMVAVRPLIIEVIWRVGFWESPIITIPWSRYITMNYHLFILYFWNERSHAKRVQKEAGAYTRFVIPFYFILQLCFSGLFFSTLPFQNNIIFVSPEMDLWYLIILGYAQCRA